MNMKLNDSHVEIAAWRSKYCFMKMGYELTRFIGEIDEELKCSICTIVLEEPMQTPCEHLFCCECIKGWVAVDRSCPVDRQSLTSDSFKPAARYLRNMLGKLDIQCDFSKWH